MHHGFEDNLQSLRPAVFWVHHVNGHRDEHIHFDDLEVTGQQGFYAVGSSTDSGNSQVANFLDEA